MHIGVPSVLVVLQLEAFDAVSVSLHVFLHAPGVLTWFRDVESVGYYFGVRVIEGVGADEVLP